MPNGTYYLYIVISDGFNTTRRYATGRLVVNNAVAGDTTRPIGALESANTVTNTAGWSTCRAGRSTTCRSRRSRC